MAIPVPTPDIGLRSLDASWTRERWEHLPNDGKRYEVIDGVLYVSTAPSSFHQWVVRQIALLLIAQIDQANVGVTMLAPIGVFMPGCDPVQPDILVVRTENLSIFHDRHVYGVPALIVEVVSPSNAEQDTQIKREAYARANVPEYWVVRPATRDVLVCAQPNAALGDYVVSHVVAPEGELQSSTLPVHAEIASFFAGAPDTTL